MGRFVYAGVALAVASCCVATGAFADDTKSDDQVCSTNDAESQTSSGSAGADAKQQHQDLLDCHFAGLDFAAGPASGGGFGAQLKGDQQKILTTFNGGGATGGHVELPNELFVGYATNDSWNSKTGSRNQISIDLRLGLDGALMSKLDLSNMPSGPQPPDCTANPNCLDYGTGGDPIAGYGIYADGRYRYGTFGQKSSTSHVNQFLAGGGLYFVWQQGLLDKPWVYIWPGVTLTYYTPLSTDTPVLKDALPSGIRADFLQAEFKTGFAFPAAGHRFRLVFAYDPSLPTTGTDRSWQSLWNVQLSADLFGSKFEPAVTFQSGKNGGLTYDQQLLIGIVTHLTE